jgi:hypothetical protein
MASEDDFAYFDRVAESTAHSFTVAGYWVSGTFRALVLAIVPLILIGGVFTLLISGMRAIGKVF